MMRILLVLIFLTVSLVHAAPELKIDDLGEMRRVMSFS
jgi:hypothetical protein